MSKSNLCNDKNALSAIHKNNIGSEMPLRQLDFWLSKHNLDKNVGLPNRMRYLYNADSSSILEPILALARF